MVALNKAEREGTIIKNPGKDIDHKLKPRAKESTRCYFTLDEVKKIIDQPGNADARLHTLIRHAGINKKVSFHVGRHTFATLTLTYGADLYTISKLLGHCNIRTTQIYAKIVDEQKRKAVNLIPKL